MGRPLVVRPHIRGDLALIANSELIGKTLYGRDGIT